MLSPREIAFLCGAGRQLFDWRWTHKSRDLTNFKPFHDQTRSLFIHIPKTAGLSVYKALYNEEVLHGHPPALGFERRDPEKFRRYFKFSFVREPEQRFISAFYFLKQGGLMDWDKAWAQKHLDRYQDPSALAWDLRNPLTRAKVLSWKVFTPQSYYLRSTRKRVCVDFLGTTEHFEEGLAFISRKLGITADNVTINCSRSPGQTRLLEPDARAVLRDVFRDDYLLYANVDARHRRLADS